MFHTDGTIEIESPQIIITPRFSRDVFLTSALFSTAKPQNQNNPFSRYGLDSISAQHGEHFWCSICFAWGRLYDFIAASRRKEFEKNEDARHEFHKKLLEATLKKSPDKRQCWPNGEEIGVTYNFPWGWISAGIDVKTWDAKIYTRYLTPEFPA